MDHLHYQEQISQLIDNELAENDSPKLFSHLSECTECREFLQETFQLRSKLTVSHPPVPTAAKLAEWRSISQPAYQADIQKPFVPFRARPQQQLPAIALMLFMLVLGGLLLSTKVDVQRPQHNPAYMNQLGPSANSTLR
jgi:anti-sigma factor RsiW